MPAADRRAAAHEDPLVGERRARRAPTVVLAAPTRQSSGTNTSSKNTSLNIASPVSSRSGRMSMPGVFMSSMKNEMPSCFGASGSVRASRIPQSRVLAPSTSTPSGR